MVYVISVEGKPLMPCENVVARLLLKDKKAKVLRVVPFTIKLNYVTTNYVQPCVHGVDTGSDKIGSAVVSEGKVIYTAEIKVRNDISKLMQRRAMYRRSRRSRKTRYREARFLNRGNSIKKDRISPTIRSKIDSHLKEIKFVNSILPISKLIVETGSFDVHKLSNPEVVDYQKGAKHRFANTKAYVLHRDKYSCQHCGVIKVPLQVHHLIYRSNGGSDLEDNLITLCKDCHSDVHSNKIKLQKGKKSSLKHASQMNVIRSQLLKILPDAVETFGYVTKDKRQELKLEKSHINDAIAIASDIMVIDTYILPLAKVSKSHGEYKLSEGNNSQKVMPRGKICGFRMYDKVRYKGNNYFVKGRMSIGYCTLMNIFGEKQVFNKPKTVKMIELKRLQARRSILCY